MRIDDHYTDPVLVARYDAENSGRADTDFYLSLAAEVDPQTVLDLGCGTGVLAVELARQGRGGRAIFGVDPAPAMLDVARTRDTDAQVGWVEGTLDAAFEHVPAGSVDLLVMTGHVAQVFLSVDDWVRVLATAALLLAPRGHLAFETRNPEARAWTRWTPDLTREEVRADDGTTSSTWVEVTSVDEGRVTFEGHTVLDDGIDRVSVSTLRFRSRSEVEQSLETAGFEVVAVYGDWDRSPVGSKSPELVTVARRR